jgi:hypothetical protein
VRERQQYKKKKPKKGRAVWNNIGTNDPRPELHRSVNPIQNHKAWNKKKGKASDIYLCPSLISRERERDGQKELNLSKELITNVS